MEFRVHWIHEDPSEGIWQNPNIFTKTGQIEALWEYCSKNNIPPLTIQELVTPK